MAKLVCAECGETNEFGAEFCAYCHAFLAWDESADAGVGQPPGRSSTGSKGSADRGAEELIETRMIPRFEVVADGQATPPGARAVPDASDPTGDPDPTGGRFSVRDEPHAVAVPPTGDPVGLPLSVTNTSTIVDGYGVEAVGAPSWLTVESAPVELLPNTEGTLPVTLRAVAQTLVPAQELTVTLRVRAKASGTAHLDVPVTLTVPVVDAPVQLRAEPRLLRVRDADEAEFSLTLDNRGSNRAVQLRLSGSDPELAVRFRFDPESVEVGPGASQGVRVAVTAPRPDPGAELSRALTVAALDGTRSVETLVTMQHGTSARVEDPPVQLEVQPSLIRVIDTTVAVVRLVADNHAGREPAHLLLKASDPERVVQVAFATPELDVAPGESAYVDVRLQAPLPALGTEVSRTLTVTATNGQRDTTTTATFVQVASASPMATLVLRTDPSVVRVRDADTATSQLVVDNRRGRTPVRVALSGTDPERAIAFAFSHPVLDVGAGQALAVGVRMDAWRPQAGQEVTRTFTISATDGDATVETAGSLVQASSRAAIETLALKLDPAVLRLGGRHRGMFTAVVDNRRGNQPVRVSMRGDDPENSLRFAFAPDVLDVAPGRAGRTSVTVRAPGAAGGQELNRPFVVAASDGRSEVVAEGQLVQAATERRPVARVLFTLAGGLAMILGGFLAFWTGTIRTPEGGLARAADLNANLVTGFFANIGLPLTGNSVLDGLITGAAQIVSVALVMVVFGALVIFGLTGRSGRLTRIAAFLGAIFLIVVFIAFAVGGVNGGVGENPGFGALTLLAGCILGYVGGLLVKR